MGTNKKKIMKTVMNLDFIKKAILLEALKTEKGRRELAKAMEEPKRITTEYIR